MNATEMALVERISRVTYYNTMLVGVYSLCYGMFFVVFIIALMDTLQRSKGSGPARFLSIVITIHGLLYTAFYALNFAGPLLLLTWPDISSPDEDLRSRVNKGNEANGSVASPYLMILPFIYIIADSTALWRSWALWPGSPLTRWSLVIVGFVNAVVALSCGIYGVVTDSLGFMEDPNYRIFYYVQIFVSVATNGLATTLIAIKAWKHRDLLRQTSLVKSSPSLQVMALLIEGGFILCAFQIVQAILGVAVIHETGDALTVRDVLSIFGDNFAAMYPLLTVTILAHNRSILADNITLFESSGSGSGAGAGLGGRGRGADGKGQLATLRFATGPSDIETMRSTEVGSVVQSTSVPDGEVVGGKEKGVVV